MKRPILLVAALVATLVVGGGIAYASIPGPDGVVHACRKNTDGSLRVIDSTATCSSGYTALNWRQVDPFVVTSNGTLSFDAGGVNGTNVQCPMGRLATGGGGIANTSSPLALTSSWPLQLAGSAPNGWQAIWRNPNPDPIMAEVTVYAICTGS